MNSIVMLLVCAIAKVLQAQNWIQPLCVFPGCDRGPMTPWIPVFTGMTGRCGNDRDVRELRGGEGMTGRRGNDGPLAVSGRGD